MKHPEDLPGGRNAKQIMNNNKSNNNISKRSNVMNCATVVKTMGRGLSALLILAFIATTAFGQNLVIGTLGAATFNGSGSYNVKGNIIDSTSTAAKLINGTVTMNGSSQTIGLASKANISIQNLIVSSSTSTSLAVSTEVTTNLNIGASELIVGTNSLTIDAASSKSTGSLNTVAGSTVIFDGSSSQTVLGTIYNGAVTLSGAGAKNLSADATVAGAFSHTNGAFTVDQNLTVSSATPSFATIANVAGGKTLTLSGTGGKSIATVTTTTASGTISNTNSGLLTIGTLSDNFGTINGGAGGVTFTSAATNDNAITGGAGVITFGSTLAHNAGTIAAGGGGVEFSGIPTIASGAAVNGISGPLTFDANIVNNGTITVTGQTATFKGNFTATGTLAFNNVSTEVFTTANSTSIPAATYGNLTISGSASQTAAGDMTIAGASIALSNNLDMSTHTLLINNASTAVSGSNEIKGIVTRTHTFTASQSYTFNNAVTVVTPTAVGTLSSFTIASYPGTNPTGYLATNSVNREYTQNYAGSGFTANIQLGFLPSEYSGGSFNTLKIFENGISRTDKMAGTVVRTTASPFDYVSLAAVSSSKLTPTQQLALDDRFNMFTSIAQASWNVASTWDANSVPGSGDDVAINGANSVTIPTGYAAAANSVEIYAGIAEGNPTTGGLTLAGTGSLAVGTGGLVNRNISGAGLTVGSSASVTITGGNLVNDGTITNAGTITVTQ
ncbi:MAG: hypothetical protein WAV76_09605 [Bacteroidota bacterium]